MAKALANQLETDKGKENPFVAAKAMGELFASLPVGKGQSKFDTFYEHLYTCYHHPYDLDATHDL